MKLYLGLDGGGTKTAAVIINEAGEELGRGVGGSGNIASNDDAVLHTSFLDAVREAVTSASLPENVTFEAVCAGVAGYSAAGRREPALFLLREIAPAHHHSLHPDYEIAWWGATAGEPGIILIAGTGAVAYGRNAAGKSWKEDGLGYLLGDRGSGFWIGKAALQRTLSDLADKVNSPLAETVLEYAGVFDSAGLLQWLYQDFQPSKVAAIAPIVGRLEQAKDFSAQEIVSEAGFLLQQTVLSILDKLSLPHVCPIYLAGGLWNISPSLEQNFVMLSDGERGDETLLRPYCPFPDGQKVAIDAAYGAALMALKGSQERGAEGL